MTGEGNNKSTTPEWHLLDFNNSNVKSNQLKHILSIATSSYLILTVSG